MRTKFTLLAILVLISFAGFSQERVKEFGLTLYNFDNFGFSYKVGKPQALWRFNSVFFQGNKQGYTDYNYNENTQKNFGVGFDIGREFRKNFAQDFQFRYGIDLSFDYWRAKTEYINSDNPSNNQFSTKTTYSPGLNLVLGVNYVLHGKFIFGAEFGPGISYRTGKEEINYTNPDAEDYRRDISDYSFFGSLSSIMLTIAYRITN